MDNYRKLYTDKEWKRMQDKLACDPDTKAWIYVIEDPSNKSQTCYIGKTEDLKERLRCHKKDKGVAYRYNFLQTLDDIKLIVLEEVPILQWAEAERFYISYFQSIGMALCNSTPGGDANPNPGYLTEEQKEHLRNINTGKKATEETKQKMSLSHQGINNGFYGKQHTEETKLKQSLIKIGKPIFSNEEKQKREKERRRRNGYGKRRG